MKQHAGHYNDQQNQPATAPLFQETHMKKLALAFIAATSLTAILNQGFSQGSTTPQPAISTKGMPQGASINWTDRVLIAEGQGTAAKGLTQAQAEVRALAAARADAQRILLGAIKGVQLTSSTTVQNFELTDDTIKTAIQGLLQNATPVANSEKIVKKDDGSFIAKVSYSIPLTGDSSLAQVVLPPLAEAEAKTNPKPAQPTVPASKPTQPVTPQTANKPAQPITGSDALPTYTGIIIDVRGKGYSPCMSPKIKMPDGSEVWGTIKTTSEFAVQVGIAAFMRRIEDAARLTERGGPGQLLVKATKVLGPAQCDVEVTPSDAALALKANQGSGFFEEFKVTFVY
jgi:hypothetical protein